MSQHDADAHAVARAASAAMDAADHASHGLGMEVLAVEAGMAKLRMTVRRDMLNGHAVCHGGFVFTLADSAFAHACNSYDRVALAAAAVPSSARAPLARAWNAVRGSVARRGWATTDAPETRRVQWHGSWD